MNDVETQPIPPCELIDALELPPFSLIEQATNQSPLVELRITPFGRHGGITYEFSGKETSDLGDLFTCHEDEEEWLPDALVIEALEEIARLIVRKLRAATEAQIANEPADE